jgi:hypothetical protein
MTGRRISAVPIVGEDKRVAGIMNRWNFRQGLVARKHGDVSSDGRTIKAALYRAVAQAGVNTPNLNSVVVPGVVYLLDGVESEQEQAAPRVAAETTGLRNRDTAMT